MSRQWSIVQHLWFHSFCSHIVTEKRNCQSTETSANSKSRLITSIHEHQKLIQQYQCPYDHQSWSTFFDRKLIRQRNAIIQKVYWIFLMVKACGINLLPLKQAIRHICHFSNQWQQNLAWRLQQHILLDEYDLEVTKSKHRYHIGF